MKLFIYFITIVYWITLFFFTSIPLQNFNIGNEIPDKVKHFVAYFILSLLFTISLRFYNEKKEKIKNIYIFSILVISVNGLIDEVHQLFIPGRLFEWLDLLADVSGAFWGMILAMFIIEKTQLINKEQLD